MAKTALLAGQVRMPTLGNNQRGFTLIELLIVILIVGIVSSLSVYSVNLVSQQTQNSFVTKLQNQVQSARHKAQLYNFSMRIRLLEEGKDNETQQIIVEYFDVDKQIWRLDTKLDKITLSNQQTILMDQPLIEIGANGFITDGQICIDDECWKSAKE